MNKQFKNVKSIGLKIRFKGNGCVNWDSNEARFALMNLGLVKSKLNENIKVAKREILNIGDEPVFKYKVSSECIGRGMYENVIPAENQAISTVPSVLYSAIANWAYISRGYMFTRGEGKPALKKKGCIHLCDAVEVGNPRKQVVMEVHSNKSSREVSTEDGAKGSTSFYQQENVGECIYESLGFIDLGELQFIPDDPTYDRVGLALFDECAEKKVFLSALAQNFPSMSGKDFGYYYSEGSYTKDEWGEHGIKLSKEAVNEIVKNIIKAILNVNILRRHATFRTESVEIEVVTDGGSEFVEVDLGNIDSFSFEYADKYIESDEEKIKANKVMFDKYMNEAKAKKSSKKENAKSNE